MKTLIQALSTTTVVLTFGCAYAIQQQPSKPEITASAQRQSVTVLLREAAGTQLGSGVLVGSGIGGYWIVTNRHVVQQHQQLCVVGADQKAIAGLVLPARKSKFSKDLDLALVFLPRTSREPFKLAALASQPVNTRLLPIVHSTGYPTPLKTNPDGPPYSENEGLLLPLLKNPLEGGFDLAYTSGVQKGMSGGGVFIGGELIGINGTHANPLWPGQWRDQDGKAVNEQLNNKLELVSLGISAEAIKVELNAAVAPSAESLNSLYLLKCNPVSP